MNKNLLTCFLLCFLLCLCNIQITKAQFPEDCEPEVPKPIKVVPPQPLSKSSSFVENCDPQYMDTQKQSETQRQAYNKIKDLEEYIKVIGNKNKNITDKIEAINLAVDLFYSENVIMQVSSKNRPSEVNNYPIRTYLERLMDLQYDRISIEWYNIQVRCFRRAPDGTYRGYGTIIQRFEGFGDHSYSDTTVKRIELVGLEVPITVGGYQRTVWDVLLGSIKVLETH